MQLKLITTERTRMAEMLLAGQPFAPDDTFYLEDGKLFARYDGIQVASGSFAVSWHGQPVGFVNTGINIVNNDTLTINGITGKLQITLTD